MEGPDARDGQPAVRQSASEGQDRSCPVRRYRMVQIKRLTPNAGLRAVSPPLTPP